MVSEPDWFNHPPCEGCDRRLVIEAGCVPCPRCVTYRTCDICEKDTTNEPVMAYGIETVACDGCREQKP